MTKKLFFFFFLLSFVGFSQKNLKEFRSKKVLIQKDTVQIDSVSINPTFFKLLSKEGKQISTDKYQVNFPKALLIIDSKAFPELTIEYLRYPDFLTQIYTPLDESLIVPNNTNTGKLYSLTTNKKKVNYKLFDGLKTQGFIVRGITTGNNQNAVTNSSLDLTIEGKLSKNVGIRANIFDTNLPLQQNGYSQSITDFDRIFIELFSKNWKVKGGDVSLKNTDTYFLNFEKQVSGLEVQASIDSSFNATASGAIVRGRFSTFNFIGVEGNQGPYKIFGPNNESAIIIVAGSDAVFVNGVRLERGENKDYIIDYNLAEIRFNTKYPITNDMRIRVEFQFSDRSYTRFITYEKAQYKSENFSISGYFYNESDAKNQPIQQSLSDTQKQILANAGNNVSLMNSPSAVLVDTYSPNRIQYRKVMVGTNETFEFSTDENEKLYTVTFTNVGTNKGSYVVDKTIAIGTIYKYVGINMGNFEPAIRLIAPTSLQVALVNTRIKPSEKTNITAELAYSNSDQNLFSSIDDGKNQQMASKVKWQQTILDGIWKLKSTVDYEFVQKNFRTVQRFRTVEFNRDWNLRNITGNQHQLATGLQLVNSKGNFVSYRFNHLNFSDNFNGNKHEILSLLKSKQTVFTLKGSFLANTSALNKDRFTRLKTKLERRFKKSWLGGFINFESNKIKERATSNFSRLSHQFQEYEGYYGIGDSTKVFTKIGLNYRTNDSVRNNALTQINNRKTIYIDSRLVKNKRTNLSIYANYRYTENAFVDNEQSLNSRLIYNQRFFNNFMSLGTAYETSSGNVARQDFVYVKTEPGQGFYTWIDYNNDGIQQFEEFEIAQFQDQASYLRVPLPNLRFVPTQRASWKQSVVLNPITWKSKKGIRKFLSYFYNQTYFLIDNEQRRVGDSFNLNPFKLEENQLVALQLNFRNSFYFNRNLQNYSWIYTYGKSRNKRQFSIGNQENNSFIHQLEFKHKFSTFWLFELLGAYAKNSLSTENLVNRNYNITLKELNPKLSFLYSKDHKLSAFYELKNKENTLGNLEKLKQHKIGVSYYFLGKKQQQINADFTMFLNNFQGNPNSPVGYQMLEGLQVGRNFTWNVLFNQKLNSFLNLNLNYFGRKSENAKAIHTGTVQLKAIF